MLGNKGETIKAIGQAARAEISEFLGRTVHLFLQVKVRPNWLEEPERYSEMGLDFKDGDAEPDATASRRRRSLRRDIWTKSGSG